MLWNVLVLILVLWFVAFLTHFGGNLIHLLLIVAAMVFVFNLVFMRRRAIGYRIRE
jgi:hypothetical protein